MQNNCSSLVTRFGATALIPAIFHFSCDLFNATARKGIIAELKAEKLPVATKKKAMKIDNQLK
ncbi:hypothetical protein J3858_004129 [Salmonella enterica subsp. enterica serovar Irumu]|nr:hypothetical protein [Salmonella enterica subsp. enterica serovar Irumu]EIF5750480.1 hypothetical protein [Salmonella enterica subsp. enterica serovar Irumu]